MPKTVSFVASNKSKIPSKDKTLTRLIDILAKLSNNERYDAKELAQEYSVSVRTIQMDIKNRLNYFFPIEKDVNGKYKLIDGATLQKSYLNPDEMMLVSLALSAFKDVSDFDKLTDSTLKKLLQPKIFNPYFIKQDDIEDLDIDSNLVENLEFAIKEQKHIKILGVRGDIVVEPYKIAAYDGIWYLVAKDEVDQKTKTFMLRRICDIQILPNKHQVSQQKIQQLLDNTHSAWFEEGQCYKVIVKVYPAISHFFKQKDFLQSQVIEEELSDGSLIVSFEVSHDEDIDNIIKSWLPDIEVIKPIRYKNKIKKELQEYLKRINTN
jgi:predicted DNA-binding transcriptional regulator YafY